jgi:hypothetical protein
MGWNTKNGTSWNTSKNTKWNTDQMNVWIGRLQKAFWDSILYTWDDLVCTWDALSDKDVWETPNGGSWYRKN